MPLRSALGQAMRIIAYTAHAMPQEIQEFKEAGFDGVLVKPIRRQDLIGDDSMDWFTIYETATGTARSITSEAPVESELSACGLSVLTTAFDPRAMIWDAATLTYSDPPPPPLRVETEKFIKAFPDAKWLALKQAAATNGTLMKFYDRIMARDTINVRDPDVVQGFALLEAGGLLTSAEATAIKTTLGV